LQGIYNSSHRFSLVYDRGYLGREIRIRVLTREVNCSVAEKAKLRKVEVRTDAKAIAA
jgi:predicted fused transcriptional regulator/phosphomethylpyrimidine kinase